MCGIAGDIRFDDTQADPRVIAAMTDTLSPRGPDGAGVIIRDRIGFGHRRLQIIDLSARARQPMEDPALGLTLVFNGTLYNYKDLRKRLVSAGYRFFSDGDTEVVLKAFHAWGSRCVEMFHGMFAFAIAERDTGRVTLARDRLGIKPLYYARSEKGLRFASTLPALVAGERAGPTGLDTDIDAVALNHYMTFHAVVPAPRTILKGVSKLPPAAIMRIERDGRIGVETYWEPKFVREPDEMRRDLAEWTDAVEAALTVAVERRLVADVPVGVLLSGGLDSSLIVGLLSKLGQRDLNTFSIGFETVGTERGDEFQYSDMVASHFGTKHHKLFIDSANLLPRLLPCIEAMAEPMVSHDAIGFYLLSEEVSRHITVVQSGQGADEVFGGYHWYPPLADSNDPVSDYARVFFDRGHDEYRRAVDSRFHGADHALDFVRDHFGQPGADTPVDKALRIDTTVMLVDDPVKRVDTMTMAFGLEARVPFLDHELVEMAARIPPEFKIAGDGKRVLKEVGYRVLPRAIIDRPKGYFPVPSLKYLDGQFLTLVRDTLTGRRARDRALFAPGYVDGLLASPRDQLTPLRGSKLWQCAVLELWLQAQGV